MENIKTVIFETHDRFPKIVLDDKGLILSFTRQNINLVTTADGLKTRLKKSDSWICTLTEEDLIERAKKHKAFKKSFWIVNKVPTRTGVSIAVSGPKTSTSSTDRNLVKEMKQKAMRFGELKAKVVKSDGSGYFSSANPNQIEEYEKLKKELG